MRTEDVETKELKIYTDYTAPCRVISGNEGGQAYARFYPAPISDSLAELQVNVIYPSSLYNYLPLDHIVKIGRGYEDAVKEYCYYRFYDQAKETTKSGQHWNAFLAFSGLRETVLPGKIKQNITF